MGSRRPSRHASRGAALGSQLALACAGAAALLWPAFDNGFPLAFQDSGWYLKPVFGGAPHPGRALGYSILARLSMSLVRSVWAVVIVQALVTSGLLVRVCVVAVRDLRAGLVLAASAIGAVLLLSGGAKYVSWLMADVTASWLFLAGALWLLSDRLADRCASGAVLALAVLSHNTHVPLGLAASAAVVAGAFLLPGAGPSQRRAAVGLAALALVAVPWSVAVNTALGSGSGLVRGASSFLVHRFADSGVLTRTLDVYCGERDWKACRHREFFARDVGRGGSFLFNRKSPFAELGGWGGDEQADLVVHALRCCAGQIVATSLVDTWKQFWLVETGYGLGSLDTRPLHFSLARLLRAEAEPLDHSRQSRGERVRVLLHPFAEVPLQAFLWAVGALVAAVAWRAGTRRPALLLGGLLAFLLANALVCAVGSPPYARYQGRVAWLLPYCLTIAVAWLGLQLRSRRGEET